MKMLFSILSAFYFFAIAAGTPASPALQLVIAEEVASPAQIPAGKTFLRIADKYYLTGETFTFQQILNATVEEIPAGIFDTPAGTTFCKVNLKVEYSPEDAGKLHIFTQKHIGKTAIAVVCGKPVCAALLMMPIESTALMLSGTEEIDLKKIAEILKSRCRKQ